MIDEDGPVLAAMAGEVALPVAIDVEPPTIARAAEPVLSRRPVWTVLPCHATFCGMPTFTESIDAIRLPSALTTVQFPRAEPHRGDGICRGGAALFEITQPCVICCRVGFRMIEFAKQQFARDRFAAERVNGAACRSGRPS